ncbi:DUF927 domain-containing protein [Pseudovibrio sp. JE062]|uniref:DUF927 domain-containing protein n=1 Tax=Pseudovibrio sp. JE062 TaxID=439495 RepID=UPI000186C774|nr:DUF927 domain-containing protein [Pseudovibrio sp. JE062]EEA95071.1 conserved hypothetical protein [Pseudovibrio sp. JE062]
MTKKGAHIEIHLLEHQSTKNDWVGIEYDRRGGRDREWHFMRSEDFHDKKKLNALIAQKSMIVGDLSHEEIVRMLPNEVGMLLEQPGWAGPTKSRKFVLFENIVKEDRKQCYFSSRPAEARGLGLVSGDLERWTSEVATKALASYPATIALLASFASPLLPLAKTTEGAVINFVAASSSGKTSINKAAYSVWGNPKHLPSWGGTLAAITQTASAHNQLICPFDDGELSDPDPKKRNLKLHSFTHILADGCPKQYSKTVKAEHESPLFTCFALSSNPISIETALKNSLERTDGDRVRFLELPVPNGDNGGIWAIGPERKVKRRGDMNACAQRSKSLVSHSEQNFGVAGKAYVSWMEKNYARLEERVSKLTGDFLKKYYPNLGGTRLRIAEKFAHIYAGGIFAVNAGILPKRPISFANACRYAIDEVFRTAFSQQLNYSAAQDALGEWFADPEKFPEFKNRKSRKLNSEQAQKGFYVQEENAIYVRLDVLETFLGGLLGEGDVSRKATRELLEVLSGKGIFCKPPNGNLTKDVRIGTRNKKIKLLRFDYSAYEKID